MDTINKNIFVKMKNLRLIPKTFCILSLIFQICHQVYSQQELLSSPMENILHFSIVEDIDTIHFLKINKDTTYAKPTILFCQGSFPIPLVGVDEMGGFIFALSNFDYNKLAEKYNLFIISKPNTPVVVNIKELGKNYGYVPDVSKPDIYDEKYQENNYLENYIRRGSKVIEFIQDQKWVDQDKIILLGHSEGAHIAAKLADQNDHIYALGYFSGNPMGRFTEYILSERKKTYKGVISHVEAQENINGLYEFWKLICRTDNSILDPESDTPNTWRSFSDPYITNLTNLKIPLYITYGTEDNSAIINDLLPIFFELGGKKDYLIRPWLHCGHNFEEINSDGSSNFEKMYWQEVMNEFLIWLELL